MDDVFLPVGSIVNIRFEDKMFMIIGYKTQIDGKVYDYSIIDYPYGYEGFNNVTFIEKDYVKNVLFEGYKNDDYSKLMNELKGNVEFEKGE